MAAPKIYQFYAKLDYFKPKIWRRFQVQGNITIAELGYILMTLFEMQASHLFFIESPLEKNCRAYLKETYPDKDITSLMAKIMEERPSKMRFEMTDEEEEFDYFDPNEESFDATEVTLSDVATIPKSNLRMNYDYGDDWWITITFEKIVNDPELSGKDLPRMIAGKGFGIVENCGGVGGLEEVVEAFKKKKGAEYTHFREWMETDNFDIQTFDIDDMNFRLKKIPRIYAQIYEQGRMPTKKSIDLIDRKHKKAHLS